MKFCSTCNQDKPYDNFHRRGNGYQSVCKECRVGIDKEYHANNKHRWKESRAVNKALRTQEIRTELIKYLQEHPCIDCGEPDIVVLQFDHVRGTKKSTVSRMLNNETKWPLIYQEIQKCDVRCANCHTRKTAKDFNWFWLLEQ